MCHKTVIDATLKAVLELDELKKDTAVTISVVKSAERLLTLNRQKKNNLQQLMAQMRQSYTRMFGSVQHYRLTAMKNEKLCATFHKFSTEFIRQLTTQTQGDPVTTTASPCSFFCRVKC